MSAAATLAGAAPGLATDWHSIDWKKVWGNVRRLQARIVKALQEGRWGFLDKDVFVASTEGTPQGGICSPALANRTLDGLETLLHERFGATRRQRQRNKIHLVRYADDFIITGTSKELLRDEVQPLVAHFLSGRGLELSHEKTSITHIDDGFDFLGQNVRRYGTKLLLKPSQKNVRSFLAKVDEVIQQEGGHLTAGELIQRLNPKIRGWALFHRHASSKETFAHVDDVIFWKPWRWARRRHRHKSAAWVRKKYFTRPGDACWTFRGIVTDEDGGYHTVVLFRARSLPIRRHGKVKGEANPYDPAWELYFEERLATQMASTLTGRGTARYLWLEQSGKCLVCAQPLTLEAGWHLHHLLWRVHGSGDTVDNLVLLHPNCHRQVHSKPGKPGYDSQWHLYCCARRRQGTPGGLGRRPGKAWHAAAS